MQKKRQFVKKLEEYDKVDDLFLVLAKQIGIGKNRQSFLRLTIGDSSGSIETRLWEGAEEFSRLFKQGDIVFIQGKVTTFKGAKQINTDRISPLDDLSKIDWSDFFPVAERPAEEMWTELADLLAQVRNPDIKRLIDAFAGDETFLASFKRSPAATSMHHAYISGLLEHTLGVVKLAEAVSALYKMNRDLLVAGAFFHDIGKTVELQAAAGFDYTDEGRLLGHLVIGLTMVREKCASLPGFPKELQTHIEHLMLSHHGELEWGSPKRPKTIEALALHAIDNIDAKLTAAAKAIGGADEGDEDWTPYLRMFERPLTRTPDFSSAKPAASPMALCEKVVAGDFSEVEAALESLVEQEEAPKTIAVAAASEEPEAETTNEPAATSEEASTDGEASQEASKAAQRAIEQGRLLI